MIIAGIPLLRHHYEQYDRAGERYRDYQIPPATPAYIMQTTNPNAERR